MSDISGYRISLLLLVKHHKHDCFGSIDPESPEIYSFPAFGAASRLLGIGCICSLTRPEFISTKLRVRFLDGPVCFVGPHQSLTANLHLVKNI